MPKAKSQDESKAITLIKGGGQLKLSEWEKEELAKAKAGVAALPVGGQFLSMRAKRWTFEGNDLGDYVDVIGIDWGPLNAWYADQKFDPNNPAMPYCFAIPKVMDNGQIDHDARHLAPMECPDKQHDQCLGCRWNDFGSGDGRGKACKNMIRTSLLLVGADNIENGKQVDVLKAPEATFLLPPTALTKFGKYLHLLAEHDTPWFSVVTRLTLASDVDYPHPEFTPQRYVTDNFKQRVFSIIKSGSAIVSLTTTQWPTSIGSLGPPRRGKTAQDMNHDNARAGKKSGGGLFGDGKQTRSSKPTRKFSR